MRLRRTILLVLAALVATGCQVRTTVTVTVEDDGSGTVEVAVGLDGEALAEVPDLDGDGSSGSADLTALVRVDDLKAAGWTISDPSPTPDDDGFVWMTATKPFGTPEEAEGVLAELTGPGGGLRDLEVDRTTSFGRTSYSFEGVADLSGGLEAFGDENLAAALGGEPLGQDAAAIESAFGRPLSEMVRLTVVVDLPGAEPETWEPELGATEEMATSSQVTDRLVVALAIVAVSCLVALAVILLTRRRTA